MPPIPLLPLDFDSLLWLIVLVFLLYVGLNFLKGLTETDSKKDDFDKNFDKTMTELLDEIRKLRIEIEELRKELNE